MVGQDVPDFEVDWDRPLFINLDATLITSHWRKGVERADCRAGLAGFTRWARGWTTDLMARLSRCR